VLSMSRLRAFLSSIVSGLLVASMATSAATADSSNSSSTAGTVDPFNGAFTTDVPITVPDFRGITPALRLAYNSASGNAWVGVGWTLSGISYIYRRGPNGGMATYGPDDAYYLDGAELIPDCTTQGGTHCTRVQNFARIIDQGDGTWTVRGTNGNLATYEPLVTTSLGTYRWAIKRLEEPNGSAVLFDYWCDGGTHADDCYPDSITYGGGAQIIFHSELRTDVLDVGRGSTFGITRYRLKSIEVRAGAPQEVARAYQLAYVESADTGRSLVASIQQFGRGAVVASDGSVTGPSLPPMTLEYPSVGSFPSSGAAGTFAPLPCDLHAAPYPVASNGCPGAMYEEPLNYPRYVPQKSTFGDFNGDGRMDTLRFIPDHLTPPRFVIGYASGPPESPIFAIVDYELPAPTAASPCLSYSGLDLQQSFAGVDINADGRSDVLQLCSSGSGDVSIEINSWITQEDGSFVHVSTDAPGEVNLNHSTRMPLDVDGDGRIDVVVVERVPGNYVNIQVGYGNGDGTFTWPPPNTWGLYWAESTDRNIAWTAGDFNGDGRGDIASLYEIAPSSGQLTIQYALSNADGSFTGQQQATTLSGYVDENWEWPFMHVLPTDLNGDGLSDIAVIFDAETPTGSQVDVIAFTSKGSGFPLFDVDRDTVIVKTDIYSHALHTNVAVGDLNADGRAEIFLEARGTYPDSEIVTLFRQDDGSYLTRTTQGILGSSTAQMLSSAAIADFSGDGVGDLILIFGKNPATNPIKSVFASYVSEAKPDLAASVANGIGGTTEIDYVASSHWSDPEVNQYLPPAFSIPTVEAVTTNDGRGNSGTSAYTYEGALWSIAERQFMGFRRVTTVVDGTGATQETVYYQLEGTVAKPEQTTIYDSSDNIVSATKYTYTADLDNQPPYTSLLADRWDYECDGAATLDGCRVVLTQFGYDGYGNVIQTKEHGRYTEVGDGDLGDERLTVRVYGLDPSASPSSYIVGLPLMEAIYQGHSAINSMRRQETKWDYDAFGNRLSEARLVVAAAPPYLPAQWSWHFWGYDGDGNVVSETDRLGAVTTTSYDTAFNLYPVQQCNHLSQCANFAWDTVLGRRLSDQDVNGYTTSYAYDALGRDQEIHRPDGGIIQYQYLNFGDPTLQRTRKIEPDGSGDGLWTDVYQDGIGRIYKTVREGMLTQETLYLNTLKRPWKESLWYGPGQTPRYIEHAYDASGRPRIAKNPDLTTSETQYGVDADGFAIRDVIDELGHAKRTWTDGLGRIVQVREWDGATPLDTTYSYDVIDRMIQSVDHMGNVSSHTWLLVGQKVYSCTPGSGCWSYVYNAADLVTSQTDARSLTVTYTYDVLGRVKTKNVPSVGLTEWFYDEPGHGAGVGRLSRLVFPGGTLSFFYDAMGRATSTERCVDSICKGMFAGYDKLDRVTAVGFASIPIEVVQYTYDSSGRLNSVPGYVDNLEWTASGRLASMTYANGAVSTYAYDENREWMNEAIVEDGSGATVYHGEYAYDAAARVDWMEVTRAAGPTAIWDYDYDALDRLTSLVGSGGAPSSGFSYDEMGNLLAKGSLPSFHYDDPTKPFAVTRVGSTKYTYDASGNRIEKGSCNPEIECTSYSAQATYAFDPDGRLTSFTNIAASQTTTYGYGPGEERVRIAGPAGTRRIFGPLLETVDAAGNVEVRFYYAGPIRVAMKDGTGTYWYHHDHLGSVRLMTNAIGAQVATSDFLPFGELFASSGFTGNNPYDFAGHRTDSESGLIYMNARYFDPAIGRFISPDRVVPDVLSPQSLNPYSYAYNNPISNTDPSGHAPVVAIVIPALFASLAVGWGTTTAIALQAVIWAGVAMSVAGFALKNPILMSVGGIMLGFAGGYGMAAGELAVVTGVLGASVGGLTSPISPLSPSAQLAIGWAWAGLGYAVAIRSDIAKRAELQAQQIANASDEISQAPGAVRGGSQGQYASAGGGEGYSPDSRWVGGSFEQMREALHGPWPEGATGWDPFDGYSFGSGTDGISPIEIAVGGAAARVGARVVGAGARAAGAATQTGLKTVATETSVGRYLFARHTGALNSNNYFRIGMGWKGPAKTGQEVFRIGIGNKNAPIHWHWP
jgi:RHS repeat-associated protein